MLFEYLILGLIIIGLLIGFGFWKLIKYSNYELNGKESLLYSISLIVLSIVFLVNFSLMPKYIVSEMSLPIILYFPLLLLMYYIIRSVKLKKYVPIKLIIFYILMSIINVIILFFLLDNTNNIDGWSALGLEFIYIVLCITYVVLLLLINFTIFIINYIKKVDTNYKNTNYKVSKYSYINILAVILIIGLIFGIDYYNEYNYNKLIEKQKEIVVDYLKQEYPNYEFEIKSTYETEGDCSFLFCKTPVFRNNIVNKTFNKNFDIDVKKEDLTIYDDGFKKIFEENMKKYLRDNYDISVKYKLDNEELEDVEFVINKNYKKEEIDLFTQNMKNVFNYVDNNFYNIDYVVLNFENGNPFYEGENEYSKTRGSINENSMTNELWIMVNNEYIFIEK